MIDDKGLPTQATALIRQLADGEPRKYRMIWQGSKIPRGAKIGD